MDAVTFSGHCGSWRLKMPPATSISAPAQWIEKFLRHDFGTRAKYSSTNAAVALRVCSSGIAQDATRSGLTAPESKRNAIPDFNVLTRKRFEMFAENLEHQPWIAGDLELRKIGIVGKSLCRSAQQAAAASRAAWSSNA